MYYRILDQTSGEYLPISYNTTDKNVVRDDLESLLINLTEDPVYDLSFNKLVDKAKGSGLTLETGAEPFEPASTSSLNQNDWNAIDDEWGYDEWDDYDHIDGEV